LGFILRSTNELKVLGMQTVNSFTVKVDLTPTEKTDVFCYLLPKSLYMYTILCESNPKRHV